jgi:hypothetical protein
MVSLHVPVLHDRAFCALEGVFMTPDPIQLLESRAVPDAALYQAVMDHEAWQHEQIAIRDRKIAELERSLKLATEMLACVNRHPRPRMVRL